MSIKRGISVSMLFVGHRAATLSSHFVQLCGTLKFDLIECDRILHVPIFELWDYTMDYTERTQIWLDSQFSADIWEDMKHDGAGTTSMPI